jgi:putative membrane protein
MFESVSSGLRFLSQQACPGWGPGQGYGPGGWQMMSPLGGGLFMILGLVLVIVLAAWVLRRPSGGPPSPPSPLAILKARYARGEISREEFERMKQDLS